MEDARDDVVRPELLLRHDVRQGVGRGEQHGLGDRARLRVEQAAEDAGEGQHVVDLVRVVGPAGGHHRGVLPGVVGRHLGLGVGQREDHCLVGHGGDVVAVEDAGGRDADEHVGALHRAPHVAAVPLGVGVVGDPAQRVVEVVAALVDRAQVVADDDVSRPRREEQPQHGRARGAGPGHRDLHVGQRLADDAQRVRQGGQHADGRAVLVVVEDGDVEQVAEPPLDLEAPRRRDVLEVDAAEAGRDAADDLHDGVDVLRVQAERPGVDAGEPLEQGGLALHDGQRRRRPDVAEAEHGGPVGDHRDGVALDGEAAGVLGVAGDGQRDPGDARGVRHGQLVTVAQRHLRLHLDLAAEVHQEGAVTDLVQDDAVDGVEAVDDRLGVVGVLGRARDVDAQLLVTGIGHVEGGHHSAGVLYRVGELADGLAACRHLQTDGDRVRHARHGGHVNPLLCGCLWSRSLGCSMSRIRLACSIRGYPSCQTRPRGSAVLPQRITVQAPGAARSRGHESLP